jgi:hypothetical protein
MVFLQERIKQDFTDAELRSLEVGEKFFWCWFSTNGHSGGMLIGVEIAFLRLERWIRADTSSAS